jgi:hypothetical protein
MHWERKREKRSRDTMPKIKADIERINKTCVSFQLTIPPKISENLAWMPQLQPPTS